MSGLILYTTEDGQNRVQLRDDGQTVWLTQLEMAELFAATKQIISLRLKNLFEDRELDEDSVVKQWLTTAEESSAVPVRGAYQGSRHANIPDHMHKRQRFLPKCAA